MTSFFQLALLDINFESHFERPGLEHLLNIYYFCEDCNYTYTYSKDDLDFWQSRVREDSLAFVRIGLVLQVIKLKLAGSKTPKWKQEFERICKDTLNASTHYANSIIKAAKVTVELINAGFSKLPTCVAQALPLAKFYSESALALNEELHEKWSEVLDVCASGQITTSTVKAVVDGEIENPKSTIKVSKKMKESLDREARERGIPVAKLLEEILADRYAEEPENTRNSIEPEPDTEDEQEFSAELLAILDECDRQFAQQPPAIRGELDAGAIGPDTIPNSS